MKVPPILREAAMVFRANGYEVYLVGGAVRDALRGKTASDFDLASSAPPSEVSAMFKAVKGAYVIPTGIKHGTVTLRYKGLSIEVTVFRKEGAYTDGRHPDSIKTAGAIEEDLSRRDFTVNAMALELPCGKRLVDPFGGQDDLKRRLIRAVGDASERFSEDGLRPLRALRFAAQTGFDVDQGIIDAIPASIPITLKVSAERIRDEFDKTLMSPEPLRALYYMEKTLLLNAILPELALCRGVEQKGYHKFDVLDHSFYALEFAALKNYGREVRLAALFHDIGKPEAAQKAPNGIWTFYQHERISAKITSAILSRFRYPNSVIENTVHLIKEHMFHYEDNWGSPAVRRFMARVGKDKLEALFQLRLSDSYGQTRQESDPRGLLPLMKRLENEMKAALSVKDLAVNGKDLIEAGFAPGKMLGIILKRLLETVIDDPALNTKENLLSIVKNM